MIDSGASTSIISSEFAQKHSLDVKSTPRRKILTAAKGGEIYVTGEVALGGCLDTVKIVAGADCNLASVVLLVIS